MPAISVAVVAAKSRKFHMCPGTIDQNHPEVSANSLAIWEQVSDLSGRGVGCYIVVHRVPAQQQVSDAAADKVRLEAGDSQGSDHISRQVPRTHRNSFSHAIEGGSWQLA